MQNYYSTKISYGKHLLILLGLLVGGLLVAGILQALFMLSVIDLKTILSQKNNLMALIQKPEHKNVLIVMQAAGTFALFFLPAYVYARIVNKNPLKHLGLRTRFNSTQILQVIGITILGFCISAALSKATEYIPISTQLTQKFKAMEAEYVNQISAIMTIKSVWDFILSVVLIALLPAIFEEVIFRGALQQILEKWFGRNWIALLVVSVIFSAVHLSYYGFLSRTALGIMLGLIFYYSRSLWLSILMHFINNFIGVFALYITSKAGKIDPKMLEADIPGMEQVGSIFLIGLGGVAAVGLFFLFKQLYKTSVHLGTHRLDNMSEE